MSNRIGNSCHCREAYSPPTQTDRGREARAARQTARQQSPQAAKFSGAAASYRSEESAALEVKTADGDTVKISFAALTQAQAGVYSAKAGGGKASAQTFSGGAAYEVNVSVDGTLDDKETAQIGDLLQTLVAASRSLAGGADRSSSPGQPANGGNFDTLSSFHYGYRAYQEFSQSALSAQAA